MTDPFRPDPSATRQPVDPGGVGPRRQLPDGSGALRSSVEYRACGGWPSQTTPGCRELLPTGLTDHRLVHPLLEVMTEQHALLPSDHCTSTFAVEAPSEWIGRKIARGGAYIPTLPPARSKRQVCNFRWPLGVNPRGWTVGVGWIDRLRVSGCIHTLEFLRRPVAEGGVQASSIVYLLKEVGESVG